LTENVIVGAEETYSGRRYLGGDRQTENFTLNRTSARRGLFFFAANAKFDAS
jgi:hypothetical protein